MAKEGHIAQSKQRDRRGLLLEVPPCLCPNMSGGEKEE